MPTYLWYGGRDPLTPPQMGAYLAQHIASARLQIDPAAGHGVLFDHWEEILLNVATGT